MFTNDKVVWKEGLFLQPQHFQQSERFLLSSMQSRFSAYNQFYFGFLQYDINMDALANNTFSLNTAKGVMPDGTYFSIPDSDSLPQTRSFEDFFSHEQMSLDVYLALPLAIPGRATVTEPNVSVTAARYKSRNQSLTDEVFGQQKKDIETAQTNFTILFANESRDNFTSMPIARLIRTANGQVIVDKSFIPPILHISASGTLCSQLRSMLEMLLAKSSNLSQGRKQQKGGFAEFASTEMTPMALLQTINTYTPVLNHLFNNPNVHPYDLYLVLLQFSGALCTFSADTSIASLPPYQHSSLSMSFVQLETVVRNILGADIEAGCSVIPLSEISPATYLATINDQKLFDVASFYLGVQADLPQKELVVGCLSRIKISPRNQLDTLIQSAMPGLPIMYASNPPADLSSKPGFIYFSVNQKHVLWDGIKATGSLALYFPNDYPNLKLELLALNS
ncbi:type VI secretion system baseplate subunit TssK [Chitinispirillales bacterium ANBcel5]|uniref:type VI secretion system baseplate subunit TssK n=1 Tax=Cellulosispirillum alkaliphilum TaxID=3039283 RepID=UPI002A53CB60|nr:type VI secretion system baseplate subunit TssK [Chitinispirillales bacterium ANBcel5]